MARIVRTRSAEADTRAISKRIAVDNPQAAEQWLEGLDRTLALISSYPGMGEQVDQLDPGVRRHSFGSYLIFYVPIENGIELRRVLHDARRIDEFFE
jgi:toxin ParE1/3/4